MIVFLPDKNALWIAVMANNNASTLLVSFQTLQGESLIPAAFIFSSPDKCESNIHPFLVLFLLTTKLKSCSGKHHSLTIFSSLLPHYFVWCWDSIRFSATWCIWKCCWWESWEGIKTVNVCATSQTMSWKTLTAPCLWGEQQSQL